eukprot:gene914-2175_t
MLLLLRLPALLLLLLLTFVTGGYVPADPWALAGQDADKEPWRDIPGLIEDV